MIKIAPLCLWCKRLFSGWVNVVGTSLTLLTLIIGVRGKDVVLPWWLFLLISGISFVFVSYRVWKREWERAESNKAIATEFRARLDDQCEQLIDAATDLDQSYLAAPEPNGPKVMMEPLSPIWKGSQFRGALLYSIGLFQGGFRCFERNLQLAKLPLMDSNVRNMASLLNLLRRYKESIAKLG